MVTRMTGDELAAHNTAEPLNVVCIEDGSGFKKGRFYVIDEEGVIHDTFSIHDHTSTAAGGTLYEIYRGNYVNLIELDMSANIHASAFVKTERSTGTGGSADGTVTDVIDTGSNTKFVQITTAGTNGSLGGGNQDYTNAIAGGGRLSFGKPATLQIKYAISHNTSVAYRMGCGTPQLGTNVGTSAQLGFEGCTGTNTNNRVFSADGTTWSGEDMNNMVQATPFGLRLDWYPSSKIVATDGLGTVTTKVSNLPPPGTATNSNSFFVAGVLQIAASTVRNLKLYAVRVVGSSHDSVSGVGGWL